MEPVIVWLEPHFSQLFLWVILIGVPSSTQQSTLLSQSSISPTPLASVTTGTLISHLYTRVLLSENRKSTNTYRFTLSHFRGLFNDHIRPIIIYRLTEVNRMDNTIFQRTSGTFSWFVLQSYDFFFILSSTLSTFFWGFRYRVSFITYKFQTLYKYTYLFLICQTFFSKCTIIINISFFSKVGHVFNICPFFLKNWTRFKYMSTSKKLFSKFVDFMGKISYLLSENKSNQQTKWKK